MPKVKSIQSIAIPISWTAERTGNAEVTIMLYLTRDISETMGKKKKQMHLCAGVIKKQIIVVLDWLQAFYIFLFSGYNVSNFQLFVCVLGDVKHVNKHS